MGSVGRASHPHDPSRPSQHGLLDVDIEQGTGFRVFEQTADVLYEKIIVGSRPGMRMKCIRHHVSTYLLKPLATATLRQAVQMGISRLENPGIKSLFDAWVATPASDATITHLFLRSTEGRRLIVEVDQIHAASHSPHCRLLHMSFNMTLEVTDTLRALAANLRGHGFEQVPGQLLVRRTSIQAYVQDGDRTSAVLSSGQVVPLSPRALQKLRGH